MLSRKVFRDIRSNPANLWSIIKDYPFLYKTVLRGDEEALSQLLSNHNDPEKAINTLPLVEMASGCGHDRILALLLDKGAHVRGMYGYGMKLNELERHVLWRLEKSADAHSQMILADTPLHLATEAGSVQCLKLLLNAGMDINIKDGVADTALHLAAQSDKRLVCLKYLLYQGADQTILGGLHDETPFAQSIYSDAPKCAKAFLDAGATFLMNKGGRDFPARLVGMAKAERCLRLFLENGMSPI